MPCLRITSIALVVLALSSLGCTSWAPAGTPVDMTVRSEMSDLTDRTPLKHDPLVFDSASGRARLFGAANETVAFALLIDGPPGGAAGIRLGVSELSSKTARIPAANITAFRMMPVKVTSFPTWYMRLADSAPQAASFYDALVPITDPDKGQPFALEPAERLAIWVDVQIPRNAAPGEYTGEIRATADGKTDATIPLTLKVYDFVLGDERTIAALGDIDFATISATLVKRDGVSYVPYAIDPNNPLVRQGLVAMRQLMVLAHEHRLDVFDRTIRPRMSRDQRGRVRLHWEQYDAVVKPYLAGTAFPDRVGVSAWPMPLSDAWPDSANYGGANDPEYAATVRQIVAQSHEHLCESMGFADTMFYWPLRGKLSQDSYAASVSLAKTIRSADAATPILSQLPPRPPELTGLSAPPEFAKVTDIYAPPAQWLDASSLPPSRGLGLAGTWLTPGQPPYLPSLGLVASPSDIRALPWFAMKYGCTGMFIGDVLNWQGDAFASAAKAHTRLFYPGPAIGAQGVLPSVRLKRLRRGLQDLAYLALLKQYNKNSLARELANSLARYAGLDAAGDNYLDPRLGGWVHQGECWEMARRLMAEEIQASVHGATQTTQDMFARQMDWRRLQEQVQTLRVEQVRSKVAPTGTGTLRATITLDLYNEHVRDSDVLVKIDKLPDGWKAVTDQVRVLPFPAATRRAVTLTIEGTAMQTAYDGKMRLPVSISADTNVRQELAVSVPLVQAAVVASPITVDGRLNDWPIRSGNSATGFGLVGARGRQGRGQAIRQTAAFVLRDDKNLYIAMRCDEPATGNMVALATNRLNFEQLLAVGEDLVEVIIDPGMTANGPEDLYHIAVKSNGVLLVERGVNTDPPLGKTRPWSVAAQVAVEKQDKAWIAELAIPLEAFGKDAEKTFWGINFCRFATQGAEASSWSQAPRYFYDPRNLGTMYVPRTTKK